MEPQKKEFYHTKSGVMEVKTYEPIQQENDQADFIENHLVILSKQTIDKFLEYPCPADLIGLYTFYYYTAKWQKTNQPKCTDNYCMKGLNWGKEKFYKVKKILIEIGLIQTIKRIDEKGKVVGWYIKLNYMWSKNKEKLITQSPCFERVAFREGGKSNTNALSVNKEMLKVNIINPKEIDKVINTYPTRDNIRNISTKRSIYNKNKLKKLIKERGADNLIATIKAYLQDCRQSKGYIKNFQTFVNNFPKLEDFQAENNIQKKIDAFVDMYKRQPTEEEKLQMEAKK